MGVLVWYGSTSQHMCMETQHILIVTYPSIQYILTQISWYKFSLQITNGGININAFRDKIIQEGHGKCSLLINILDYKFQLRPPFIGQLGRVVSEREHLDATLKRS